MQIFSQFTFNFELKESRNFGSTKLHNSRSSNVCSISCWDNYTQFISSIQILEISTEPTPIISGLYDIIVKKIFGAGRRIWGRWQKSSAGRAFGLKTKYKFPNLIFCNKSNHCNFAEKLRKEIHCDRRSWRRCE